MSGSRGRRCRLGEAKLSVFKPIVRCVATHVNLDTGERDIDMVGMLREHFGRRHAGDVFFGGRWWRGEGRGRASGLGRRARPLSFETIALRDLSDVAGGVPAIRSGWSSSRQDCGSSIPRWCSREALMARKRDGSAGASGMGDGVPPSIRSRSRLMRISLASDGLGRGSARCLRRVEPKATGKGKAAWPTRCLFRAAAAADGGTHLSDRGAGGGAGGPAVASSVSAACR